VVFVLEHEAKTAKEMQVRSNFELFMFVFQVN